MRAILLQLILIYIGLWVTSHNFHYNETEAEDSQFSQWVVNLTVAVIQQKRNLGSLPAVISIESWYCQEDKTWLPLAGISLSHREIFKSYLDCIDWQCLSCSMWYPRASAGVIGKPFWWAESLCNDVVTPLVTGTAVSLSSGSSPSSSSSSPKHQRKVERLIVSERSYKMLSQ